MNEEEECELARKILDRDNIEYTVYDRLYWAEQLSRAVIERLSGG